ncbi:MAG: hypothetical protein KGJ79_02885 [Alphaproteobacteria bacterium]|nr:hypothetical protein [Alphaproteobacteria bacterium]MDE2110061.1 hypothetical protein [Alphaproteobacteria bacterium]MDE2492992.1 hypothetical protein [Alphaproteobacteria bacterium]
MAGVVTGCSASVRARAYIALLGFGALLVLAGCAETVDEGATDYRKATINSQSALGEPTDISKKYALSSTTDFAGNGSIPITAGRRYYVSLLQAFVGPEARVGGTNWFHEHEQVALVLRVHDSNDRAHPASSGHDDCDDADGMAGGPSDSAQSQVVGPDPGKRRTWEARERDLFNLIDTDGYSTRYTLTLLPAGGVAGLPYPRFEAGNYVLMRHDKRDNALEWDRLQLDNNTGRLVYAGTHSDANGKLASRDPYDDKDLNYQSRKQQYDASGKSDLWQEKVGDYREQSYVTLQINALDDAPPVVDPPRYRSLTQERAIDGKHQKQR